MSVQQVCKVSGKSFLVRDEDIALLEKISPVIAGKKYFLPLPTLCPAERLRRRLVWRNEKHLYKRKCDATGKRIVSTYSPENTLPIYEQKFRWSDNWDPMEYCQDFDFSR